LGFGNVRAVLIEKLLRTVPDVGKIYVLIKAKNREAALKRLKNEVFVIIMPNYHLRIFHVRWYLINDLDLSVKIINTEIFQCLRQMHGKSYEAFMLSKLIPLAGNVCEPDLGIDENSAGMIAEDVDVIVNSAANTNFHERFITSS